MIDFVKDGHDHIEEENPRVFKSTKTGRGPLTDDWVKEYLQNGKTIMCAYKLCKVEFRYWGMQTRVERWIHDLALRVRKKMKYVRRKLTNLLCILVDALKITS